MSGRDILEQDRPSRIPEFATLQEEAEFWDTHNITDLLDELRPNHVHFAPKLDRASGQELKNTKRRSGPWIRRPFRP
jgi:hypothetical protein